MCSLSTPQRGLSLMASPLLMNCAPPSYIILAIQNKSLITTPQIIPPLDSGIAASIEKNLQPWPTSWDDSVVDHHPNVTDPLCDIIRSYGEDLRPSCSKYDMNRTTPLRFTYTPMHGVGAEAVKHAFEVFGLPGYIPVPEQVCWSLLPPASWLVPSSLPRDSWPPLLAPPPSPMIVGPLYQPLPPTPPPQDGWLVVSLLLIRINLEGYGKYAT